MDLSRLSVSSRVGTVLKTHTVVEEVYLAKLMQANYSHEEYLQITKLPIWHHPEEGEKLNLAVLIFSVDYTSEKFNYNNTEKMNLVRFIIKNILGDLIDPELHWQSSWFQQINFWFFRSIDAHLGLLALVPSDRFLVFLKYRCLL